jgi:hypothetical protein
VQPPGAADLAGESKWGLLPRSMGDSYFFQSSWDSPSRQLMS